MSLFDIVMSLATELSVGFKTSRCRYVSVQRNPSNTPSFTNADFFFGGGDLHHPYFALYRITLCKSWSIISDKIFSDWDIEIRILPLHRLKQLWFRTGAVRTKRTFGSCAFNIDVITSQLIGYERVSGEEIRLNLEKRFAARRAALT